MGLLWLTEFFKGGDGGNRTPDTRIFSPLLYQLSYITSIRPNLRIKVVDRGTKLDKSTFGAKRGRYFLRLLNA
jgi:hypothetical protein